MGHSSSQSLDAQNKSDPVCALLEEIGLPAVRIEWSTAEVVSFNALFSSVVDTAALPDYRLWFVEGVLRYLIPADKARWEAALARRIPIATHVRLKCSEGRTFDSVMRAVPSLGREPADQSILCVFVLCTGPYFERLRETWIAEGEESERSKIQAALHENIVQQLLAAAFGCKVMAEKIGHFDERLGKEASDLAELANQAVQELQSLVTRQQGT